MSSTKRPSTSGKIAATLNNGKMAVLRLLKEAREDAEDAGRDLLQYAVTKRSLLQAGITESDLHWLVDRRYAEEVVEVTQPGDAVRQFRTATAFTPSDNACFVLSHAGQVYIELHGRNGRGLEQTTPPPNAAALSPAERIRWDGERHELWVDGKLAKRFKRRAPVQWAVFELWQAQGWQAPLTMHPPGDQRRDPGQRLRELVAELNRGLDQSQIHIRKDCEENCITFDLP